MRHERAPARVLVMAAIHLVLVFSLFAAAVVLLNGIDEFNELEPISPLRRSLGNAACIGLLVLWAPAWLVHRWVPGLFENNALEWSLVGLNSLLYGSVAAWLWSKVARRSSHASGPVLLRPGAKDARVVGSWQGEAPEIERELPEDRGAF